MLAQYVGCQRTVVVLLHCKQDRSEVVNIYAEVLCTQCIAADTQQSTRLSRFYQLFGTNREP